MSRAHANPPGFQTMTFDRVPVRWKPGGAPADVSSMGLVSNHGKLGLLARAVQRGRCRIYCSPCSKWGSLGHAILSRV